VAQPTSLPVKIHREEMGGWIFYICHLCGRVDSCPVDLGYVPAVCIYHDGDGSIEEDFLVEAKAKGAWNVDPVVEII
jgi:hypothetical protein